VALVEPLMPAVVDGLFVLTVLGLAVPVARHLPLRARVLLVAWLLAVGVLAAAGVFLRDGRVPPYFAGVGLLPSAAGVTFVCSRSGAALLARTSPTALIGLQSFRVIVEIVLWALATQHRLSPLLTFEGRNFDILVGLTALPVAWLCFVRRAGSPRVAVGWNVAGIAILANIVIHALLSAPTPFQALRTEPPTTIIATLPYIWLPGFLVPLALSLHVASLRTLGVGPAPAKETR
jgi:hypothetical protein